MDNTAAAAVSPHCRRAQGENKGRRSNRVMTHSHRKNNGFWFKGTALWLFQQGTTITLGQSIECIMDLKCGVTSGTSRATKSDSFPSVDRLEADQHGKHHTHHRLAAK